MKSLLKATADQKKPVLFYIHGGGFQTGDGSSAGEPEILMSTGKIVVVSILSTDLGLLVIIFLWFMVSFLPKYCVIFFLLSFLI